MPLNESTVMCRYGVSSERDEDTTRTERTPYTDTQCPRLRYYYSLLVHTHTHTIQRSQKRQTHNHNKKYVNEKKKKIKTNSRTNTHRKLYSFSLLPLVRLS